VEGQPQPRVNLGKMAAVFEGENLSRMRNIVNILRRKHLTTEHKGRPGDINHRLTQTPAISNSKNQKAK
jgi:hypothetical protein